LILNYLSFLEGGEKVFSFTYIEGMYDPSRVFYFFAN
jgi:hypothetical protein